MSRASAAACRSCCESIHPTGPGHFGVAERGILALVNPERLRRILTRMLDENEFLSPYGIRSLSHFHASIPTSSTCTARSTAWTTCRPSPTPACSAATPTGAGPIWMPVNALIIRALLQFYLYYGDNFTDRVPDRLGQHDEPVRGEPGRSRERLDAHLPAGRAGPAAGVRRHGEVPDRPALARSTSSSTSTSTATTAPAWAQPPDRLDRAGGEADRALRNGRSHKSSWARQGRGIQALSFP